MFDPTELGTLREALQPCAESSLGADASLSPMQLGWEGAGERVCRNGHRFWLAAGFEQMTSIQRHPQGCGSGLTSPAPVLWGWRGAGRVTAAWTQLHSAITVTGIEGAV